MALAALALLRRKMADPVGKDSLTLYCGHQTTLTLGIVVV